MKTWINPEVEALDLACTEYGSKYSSNYDEVRVDQNGQYWFSFSSGVTVSPEPTDKVEKID